MSGKHFAAQQTGIFGKQREQIIYLKKFHLGQTMLSFWNKVSASIAVFARRKMCCIIKETFCILADFTSFDGLNFSNKKVAPKKIKIEKYNTLFAQCCSHNAQSCNDVTELMNCIKFLN